jgi:hypothetical protein
MSTSTINGNAGGAASSGAQVQCLNIRTKAVVLTAADASGNYTFSGLAAGTYNIMATLAGNVYYHPRQIIADGTSTYSDVNLAPTALNANNALVQANLL